MSNAVFPTLAGLDIKVKRTPLWSTEVLTTESGKEQRAAWWSTPRYKFSLGFNYLRQGLNGNEAKTLVDFFHQHRGQFESFLFSDPYESAVTAKLFGTGTGAVAAYQLVDGAGYPVTEVNGTPTIYRTDWQGTYKLTTNSRTNLASSSGLVPDTWTKNTGVTGTSLNATGPDGKMSAGTIVYDGSGAAGDWRAGKTPESQPAGPVTASIWLRAASPVTLRLFTNMPGIAQTVNITTTWQRFSISGQHGAMTFQIVSPAGVNTPFTIEASAVQIEAGTGAVVNLAVEGDSISAVPSPVGGVTSWPAMLSLPAGSAYSDTAVSGTQTSAMYGIRWPTYKNNGYTHFAILGGTNDIGAGTALATTQGYLSSIWSEAAALYMTVIAMTIPPRGNNAGWTGGQQANLIALNDWIRAQAAANGYLLVDTYALLGDPATPTQMLPAYDCGDGLHPSTAGQAVIANAMNAIFAQPIGTAPTSYIPTPVGATATVPGYTLSSGGLVTIPETTVAVTGQSIGTGTGSNPAFTVTAPNGTAPTITSIYRTDWQGRQKMYPTSRTNQATYSEPILANMAFTSGGVSTGSITDNGLTNGITFPALAQTDYAYQSHAGIVNGATVTAVFYVKRTDLGTPVVTNTPVGSDFCIQFGSIVQSTVPTVTSLGGNLYRVAVTVASLAGVANTSWGIIRSASCTGKGFTVTGYQLYMSNAPGAYIKTTGAAASATDYSLSGATVTFATNPASGAVIESDYTYQEGLPTGATLTWTGAYYRRVRFDMDEMDMERIFGATAAGGGQTWEGKTIKLVSVK